MYSTCYYFLRFHTFLKYGNLEENIKQLYVISLLSVCPSVMTIWDYLEIELKYRAQAEINQIFWSTFFIIIRKSYIKFIKPVKHTLPYIWQCMVVCVCVYTHGRRKRGGRVAVPTQNSLVPAPEILLTKNLPTKIKKTKFPQTYLIRHFKLVAHLHYRYNKYNFFNKNYEQN